MNDIDGIGEHARRMVAEANCCTKPPGVCNTCGTKKTRVDCWNCGGDIYVDHDCGEDSCCCLYPEDNIICDICDGKGHIFSCIRCHPECFDEQ